MLLKVRYWHYNNKGRYHHPNWLIRKSYNLIYSIPILIVTRNVTPSAFASKLPWSFTWILRRKRTYSLNFQEMRRWSRLKGVCVKPLTRLASSSSLDITSKFDFGISEEISWLYIVSRNVSFKWSEERKKRFFFHYFHKIVYLLCVKFAHYSIDHCLTHQFYC